MQIVIEIPDKMYESVQDGTYCGTLYKELKNGKPLPKGRGVYGELITKEQAIELVEFYQMNPQHFNFVDLIDEIKDEKPIIEADKAESEEV